MKKFLCFKTLYFLNGTMFIQRGKLYPENVYNTTKTLQNLQLKFKTDQIDEIVSFSDNLKDDMHIDKVFQDYDSYKAENKNEQRQGDKK